MRKISFTKMVASGNDFMVVENSCQLSVVSCKSLARKICDRKYGVGADGLLVLEKSKIADVKMRIFNPDGSEAEMCGNGARCVALLKSQVRRHKSQVLKIETKAGVIESEINGECVKIKLTEPKNMKLNLPIKINNRTLQAHFVNIGVPHTVIFVADLDKIDVLNLGRQIRYHNRFKPAGTNVDFVEVLNNKSIKIKTYERGVEDETLACGTGVVASALLYAIRSPSPRLRRTVPRSFSEGGRYTLYAIHQINVITKSKETLEVYFNRINNNFKDVWLEGKAKIVYTGVYNV